MGVQKGSDLPKEPCGVWDFVDHPEGEDKINWVCYTKIVGSATASLDEGSNTSSRGTFPENIQHLLLEIDSNNPAMAADETSHADGKEPHATADVQHSHPWMNICPEHFLWVMEEPPQEIVEQVSVSPGTDMVFQNKAPAVRMLFAKPSSRDFVIQSSRWKSRHLSLVRIKSELYGHTLLKASWYLTIPLQLASAPSCNSLAMKTSGGTSYSDLIP